jgi:hypothetical protein
MGIMQAKKMQMGAALESGGSTTYDVCLPEAGLGWEKIGPLFERYSVPLVGDVDEHWVSTYQRVAQAAPNLTRFRLDSRTGTVSFTCRATDGPVQVMGVLKILGEMLDQVNHEASSATAGVHTNAGIRRKAPPVGPRLRPVSPVRSK